MNATREPAVAGAFYPASADRLRADVTALLTPASGKQSAAALVAPHAGYIYSGRTAALVLTAVTSPAVCVVIAPNHTGRLSAPQGGSILLSR